MPSKVRGALGHVGGGDRLSRFRIDHPAQHDLHADAGHDAVMGYFVDLMRGHRVLKSYDSFHPSYNRAKPLIGCLDFLVSEGFFTGGELEDTLVFLQDDELAPIDMRVVEIVIEFKRSAE